MIPPRQLATNIDMHVASQLRKAREMRKRSMSSLGEELGVSFQQVQKYETGAVRLSAGRLCQFARALDVPVSFFFEGAPAGDNPAPSSTSIVDLETISPQKADAIRMLLEVAEMDISHFSFLLSRLQLETPPSSSPGNEPFSGNAD